MKDTLLTQQLLEAVNAYQMPDRAKELVARSDLLALCGVTAAGKNTIANYLIEHENFEHVISHTTRPPRENHGMLEQNGVDYWFTPEEDMLQLVKNQAFVEVKPVHGDTFYGTSIMAIEKALENGKRPVLEIDIQGTLEIARAVPSLKPLFIIPPNYEVWMRRLGLRGHMPESVKARRFASARVELEMAIANPAFLFVVNEEVEYTAKEVIGGIDGSEDAQSRRRQLAKELLSYLDRG